MTPGAARPAPTLSRLPRFVVEIPGLKLVTMTNGPQFRPFAKARAAKKQKTIVRQFLDARSLRCPFALPLVVTITRVAFGRMDSDNAVAAAKYVRDTVAEWIGVNDRREDLVEYVVRQEKGPRGQYAVKIAIAPRGVS